MNRTCDLAPAWAISLVPGWTVLPALPSFQGAPCSGNMLLPATTWDLHIPGESFSERHYRQAKAAAVCATCPLKRDCLAVACQEAAPSGGWGGQRQKNSTHAKSGKHHRMLQVYIKSPA